MKSFFSFSLLLSAIILTGSFATVAEANHSWGGFHWARTANPFTLTLGDNLTSNWDPYLKTASTDWSVSTVLDTVIRTGKSNVRTCRPTAGRIEVCNYKYGQNGWLGIASVWTDANLHITQGTAKMNDSYFSKAPYNTSAWKQMVMCQEIAHTFGLDHQDEDFYNQSLGTCMDYAIDPTPNQHPNLHDYEELETIYAHLDSSTTLASSVTTAPIRGKATMSEGFEVDIDLENRSDWGREVHKSRNGSASVFERDLGNGKKVITSVIWDEEQAKENVRKERKERGER